MPSLPNDLAPLIAVAAVRMDREGRVIEANAGFLRLLEPEAPKTAGAPAAAVFVQPSFALLAQANGGADGDIYSGPLTVGDPMKQTRSLRGRVWREDGEIRVLAEYDIDDLERLCATALELNADYAAAQRELAQANLRLRQREAEILAISLTDPLTGVGNRRRLEEALPVEIKRAERTGENLCVFVADLDHFKRVNDLFGHDAGDAVLAAFADCLRRHTRASDVVVRAGGEEFIVLMPHTELDDALLVADRFRASLAAVRINPLPHPVTVSVGVAERAPREDGPALIRRADQALYRAKAQGRNRVIADCPLSDPVAPAAVGR